MGAYTSCLSTPTFVTPEHTSSSSTPTFVTPEHTSSSSTPTFVTLEHISSSSTPTFATPVHTFSSSMPTIYTPEHGPIYTEDATVWKQYLYSAAHRGDWRTTERILSVDPTLINAELNGGSETALHVAVGMGKSIHYVEELVNRMQLAGASLEKRDLYGQTPLVVAAIIGNIEAAKLLVHSNPDLLYLGDQNGLLPIHIAAQYGQKDMLLYLLKVTNSDHQSCPYGFKSGAQLLHYIIQAEFYDMATSLVRTHSELIVESYIGSHSVTPPLTMLASNPSAFRRSNWWRRVFDYIFFKWQINYDQCSIGPTMLVEERQSPWIGVRFIPSLVQHFRPTKSKRDQAIQLVNHLCEHARRNHPLDWYKDAFHVAAENGIVEIVEELAETFPDILWVTNGLEQNVFHVAVLYRHLKIFNLVYRIAKAERYKARAPDCQGNNVLHMAGILAPIHRLNEIRGAVQKMRYELLWFEEVGNSVPQFQREERNKNGKTPKELFTIEHEQLLREGEQWMKSTASSCATPSALIASVVFTAAIAVPTSSKISMDEEFFTVFAVLDALSLFTSLISLIMSVSILTSRYTESEFMKTLPCRILIGLLTLFFSIAFMMVAFGMILYLTVGHRHTWVLVLVFAAACVPAISFMVLHYSLLIDMIFYWRLPRKPEKKGRPLLYTRSQPEIEIEPQTEPRTEIEPEAGNDANKSLTSPTSLFRGLLAYLNL